MEIMPKGFLIKFAFFKYELIWKMVMPFLHLNKYWLQLIELVLQFKSSKEEQRLITLTKTRVEQLIEEAAQS